MTKICVFGRNGSSLLRSAFVTLICASTVAAAAPPTEAPTGFKNRSNGFEDQAAFDKDREGFEAVEGIADGLGPVYNSTSCVACHQNPVTGSASQIPEIRAGEWVNGIFKDHPGGSIIHQRAIDALIQEHVKDSDNVRTLRMSTSILGDGFVEVISDRALKATVATQNTPQFGDMRGTIALVPTPTGLDTSELHVGRFGWKNQHASLLAFSADAYINEMGITSPLQPNENTSDGRNVDAFDPVADPEDDAPPEHPFGVDVEVFTRFMRATTAPPRDFGLLNERPAEIAAGEAIFAQIGCAVCHVPAWTTMPTGARAPGFLPGQKVPAALGNKRIHPYSDFLLHDVGTGDGIVQLQHAQFPSRAAKGLKPAVELPPETPLSDTEKSSIQSKIVIYHATGIDQTAAINQLDYDAAKVRQVIQGDVTLTANMLRTAPLWGLRTRPQLLHDGTALTVNDAILAHKGQADKVRQAYVALTQDQKDKLLLFLRSL